MDLIEMMMKIDDLILKVADLEERIEKLEQKLKNFKPQEPELETRTYSTDAVEDFLQNFPNATEGQAYRVVW
jgi:phage shock protein A